MKDKIKEILPRLPFLVLGLFILAFGIALSTKSGLGVSPSSSLAYLLSELFPLSMGMFTTLMNVVYILIQLLILGKRFHPSRLLQLLVVFLFGYFTDFTLMLVAPIQVDHYPGKLLLCIASCIIMGFGVFLEVKSNVISMASEGALSVIAAKTGKDFGQIKIVNDCICVVASVILSLIFFHEIHAVREGTVIAAVLVGMVTQFCNRHFHIRILERDNKHFDETVPGTDWSKEYPLVITIEREFGSGGREIGSMLSKILEVPCYDEELIQKTAEETGLPFERVQKSEERINSLAYALYNQTNAYTNEMSAQDSIFEAQKKIISSFADRESCVIIGRHGAFILKNRPNTLHIFISAKEEFRAARIAGEYHLEQSTAMELVRKVDALRHNYCRHFTGSPWGLARHYRLCLDTSAYGIDESVRIIREALKDFQPMYLDR